jgi:uncharacterized membrane protein YtjA (UPF0391 family)
VELAPTSPVFGRIVAEPRETEGSTMLYVVGSLLIIALISAVFGFSGVAGTGTGLAKIGFVMAIVLLAASLIFEGIRGSFGRHS